MVAPYSGQGSRTVDAGGIKITTYCGHFGLSFPCWELVRQFQDERARRVCLDVAGLILHQTARNRFGMVLHADSDDFTIPDTCYFVVTPLMIGYALDPSGGAAFRDQAVYQLRTFVDVFLDRQLGLAKTILGPDGTGVTYWTRATGWLLWSITGVLRYLPPAHPDFARFTEDLRGLAEGIARAQDPSGALHLFTNDPASPLETTGTAMVAMGLHEAVRKGWLPALVHAGGRTRVELRRGQDHAGGQDRRRLHRLGGSGRAAHHRNGSRFDGLDPRLHPERRRRARDGVSARTKKKRSGPKPAPFFSKLRGFYRGTRMAGENTGLCPK